MELMDLLQALCEPLGPPGREDEARRTVLDFVRPHAHRLEVDRMGNLQAWLNPDLRPRVMLDAHLDEVGFVVQRVDEGGFLRVAPLGGVEAKIMPGSAVLVQPRPGQRLRGVVGLAPPHVEKKGEGAQAPAWERLYVDLGLGSAEAAAAAGIQTGAAGVVDAGAGPLGPDCFYARNLDDRAGCAALVALLMRLKDDPPPVGLVFNFAVGEEVGLRGATTAAFHLEPDLALVVEATVGDTPGVEPLRNPSRLGQGPAVTVADGRVVVPWTLVDSLEEAAIRAGVKCQRKLPPYGGTDAGAISLSRGGVPTAVLSVPCRYIHSPVSVLNLGDLAGLVDVAAEWLGGAGELARAMAGGRL